MMAARWPRTDPLDEKMLVVDPRAPGGGAWRDARVRDLPEAFRAGDLIVVNDAATVPASFAARTSAGAEVELRLASPLEGDRWRAVLFGEGDWRTPTEHRPPPPAVEPGERLSIAPDLDAVVEDVDRDAPRLLVVRFVNGAASAKAEEGALWTALYRCGRPIQYAYVAGPLALWDVQTPFASRPWAVEMPSAGRPLTWALVAELRRRDVGLASLTHAAGLSSTGDPALDARLPLPERFDLPEATVRAIDGAHAKGGRVFAVGTTVVRALEGSAEVHGRPVAGEGTTDLHLSESSRLRVVDGLLTGMHESGSSHRRLLAAFAPEPLLARAWAHAEARGYLAHEFGDLCLVLSR